MRTGTMRPPTSLCFAGVTALALLRHLTNPNVLGEPALDGGAGWHALQMWLALPQVALLREPVGWDEFGEDAGRRTTLNLDFGAAPSRWRAVKTAFVFDFGCGWSDET